MLEVGSVRAAHRMTVLAKNVLDSAVSCLAFWAYVKWSASSLAIDAHGEVQHHMLIFQCAFCATAVTICSGSMAERTHMGAYLCYAAVMAGMIYPVIADSAWGTEGGLLYKEFHGRIRGGYLYHDFAGSGVVHFTGGCSALVGNFLLGRRIMRPKEIEEELAETEKNTIVSPREKAIQDLECQALEQERILRPDGGWPRRFDNATRDGMEFAPCSYLQVMGMFMLWVGWYAFNAGSTLSMDEDAGFIAGVAVWNTTLAAAGGCIGAYLFCLFFRTHLDTTTLCNGTLSGLVAITAGCDVASGHIALLIGLAAGLIVYPLSNLACQGSMLDDPVEVVAVHFGCGLWGVLAVSFCKPDCHRVASLGPAWSEQLRFCSEDHSFLEQFLAQVWGALTCWLWTTLTSLVLWGTFALSECTRALEVQYLEEAVDLLCKMVVLEPNAQVMCVAPSDEIVAQLRDVAHHSPLARRILRQHGWSCKKGGFADGHPKNLWSLRHDLQQARGERAETALEMTERRVVACFASWLHRCPLTREAALLRLRIPPAAELSGLGAANADGGHLVHMIRRSMKLLVQVRQDQMTVHSPLRREVRELSLTVRSQEVLLEALMRSSRGRSNARRDRRRFLHSVPESREGGLTDSDQPLADSAVPPELHPTEVVGSDLVSYPVSEESVMADARAGAIEAAFRLPRSISHSSDRTVSDRSAGALTPHSANEDTPPPTVIGRAMHARPRVPAVQVAETGANELVSQIVGVLHTHQQLLSTLQQAARPSSESTTPESRRGSGSWGTQHQLQHQVLQTLMAAQLQQPGRHSSPRRTPSQASSSMNSSTTPVSPSGVPLALHPVAALI